VVLLAAVGFVSVKDMKDVYRSAGSINVQSTSLLETLDGTSRDPGFGYETPAAATASSINSLIGTDAFVEEIAKNAGFEPDSVSNPFVMAEIRMSVGAFPAGRTLVKIGASNEDPTMAQRLALATMTTFTESVINGEVQESLVAVDVLTNRQEGYQASLDEANQALIDYVTANGVVLGTVLPPDQQAQVARLTGAIARAEERLFGTQTNLETAQLELERTESSVVQRLRTVDAPRIPLGPESKAKQMVLSFAMFVFIGLLLGLGGIALGTLLDHSIRFPGDVNDRLGLRVLAIVPKEGSRKWNSLRGLAVTGASRSSSPDTIVPAAPAAPRPATASLQLDLADPAPVAAPAVATNGDATPASAPAEHPPHRQRRRPGGTRPSVTLRKDN
jgi:capsular polysaccharide biosynthesis protein